MDNRTLRIACEVAGLEVRSKAIAPGWEAGQHEPGCVYMWRWWSDDDPALRAFVASLLAQQVSKTPHHPLNLTWLCSDNQRIHAALDVLRPGWKKE